MRVTLAAACELRRGVFILRGKIRKALRIKPGDRLEEALEADTGKPFNRREQEKCVAFRRLHNKQPIRLPPIRGQLGQKLGGSVILGLEIEKWYRLKSNVIPV
jgi:bifunctional DNA-binding transcriptional regulator/antitoxin component of YhaV-PrlF toxin-antitoxin module